MVTVSNARRSLLLVIFNVECFVWLISNIYFCTTYFPLFAKIQVVGDIHGQYQTMLHIFQSNGFPSKNHVYIFNGDYLDKGHANVQVFTALLAFKLHCPECIHFTRGNHEAHMFLKGRMKSQLIEAYGAETYELVMDTIKEIPIALVLDKKILFIHAGISSPDLTLDEIKSIPKSTDSEDHLLMNDLLWSEPKDDNGLKDLEFGPDVSKAFLEKNNLEKIIRGHTTVESGYLLQHEGRVVTIWSAPRKGQGAYANIDSNLDFHVKHFDAYSKFEPTKDWSMF